jgi:transcription elongation GreA/GreB family factor
VRNELPERQKACGFCFEGLHDVRAVKARYSTQARSLAKAPTDAAVASPGGIRPGQAVVVRYPDADKTATYVLHHPSMSAHIGETLPDGAVVVSPRGPVGSALLGCRAGETVWVALPKGGAQGLEISDVR